MTDWRWTNFRPGEADGGVARLEPTFLDRLQDLRTAFGWLGWGLALVASIALAAVSLKGGGP